MLKIKKRLNDITKPLNSNKDTHKLDISKNFRLSFEFPIHPIIAFYHQNDLPIHRKLFFNVCRIAKIPDV